MTPQTSHSADLAPPEPDCADPEGDSPGARIDVSVDADGWRVLLGADPADFVAQWAGAALDAAGARAGDIAVLLTDDAELQRLNSAFRQIDAPTNVLSFPGESGPHPFGDHLGDIAIALETVSREASEQAKRPADHAAHLIAHGVLHLLGYDHDEDAAAETMERMERDILASRGLSDPYAQRAACENGPDNDG